MGWIFGGDDEPKEQVGSFGLTVEQKAIVILVVVALFVIYLKGQAHQEDFAVCDGTLDKCCELCTSGQSGYNMSKCLTCRKSLAPTGTYTEANCKNRQKNYTSDEPDEATMADIARCGCINPNYKNLYTDLPWTKMCNATKQPVINYDQGRALVKVVKNPNLDRTAKETANKCILNNPTKVSDCL